MGFAVLSHHLMLPETAGVNPPERPHETPTTEQVLEALKPVKDPELGFSIVDLGLIYDTSASAAGDVEVRYTLTSPTCPFGPEFEQSVRDAVAAVPGVKTVTLTLTFDPPWGPEKITESLRRELRMMGMPV